MSDDHGPVPDDVARLVEFMNTLDIETGSDVLDRGAYRRWSARDRALARDLRSGLRAAALAGDGGGTDRRALEAGTKALGALPIDLAISPAGPGMVPRGTGARRRLAEVAIEYLVAAQRGRFARVKLCASPDCRWTYWDGSRNGSRRWCAMAACGSRSKMRAYRARLADGPH